MEDCQIYDDSFRPCVCLREIAAVPLPFYHQGQIFFGAGQHFGSQAFLLHPGKAISVMEAWVLGLPVDTGQSLDLAFKAWRSTGTFQDVRWDFRKVLIACGYDMNARNGGVKQRLGSFRGALGDVFGCLGMTLSPPHLGAPLMSIAQKRREGEDYVDSYGDQAEQEWYVNTPACIAFLTFMALHRKGEGRRWVVLLLLRKFISTCSREHVGKRSTSATSTKQWRSTATSTMTLTGVAVMSPRRHVQDD